MGQKKAAGIIFRFEDGSVALQRRGQYKEDGATPESWQGLCQATATGGSEDGESHLETAMRELGEELGKPLQRIADEAPLKTLRTARVETDERSQRTFVIFMRREVFEENVFPWQYSGGIVYVSDVERIVVSEKSMKADGVPADVLAMFRDERAAVEEALSLDFPS